jgi:hypothetical protein
MLVVFECPSKFRDVMDEAHKGLYWGLRLRTLGRRVGLSQELKTII